MSQHCPGCPNYLNSCPADAVGDVRAFTISPCPGCGHDKMARQYLAARELHPPPGEGWIEFALSVLSRSAEACGHETELAALRGALVVADEMSELLCTLSDPEYLQRIRLLAKGAVARYQAAREKVGK